MEKLKTKIVEINKTFFIIVCFIVDIKQNNELTNIVQNKAKINSIRVISQKNNKKNHFN